MLLLGIDIGTSSVKVSVLDSATQKIVHTASYPETEALIISTQSGWAEQAPMDWWQFVQSAILTCHRTGSYNPKDITAIGLAYQMHGLVMVDKDQKVLRNSILWCDSRAVEIGNKAFETLGKEACLTHLLNSPGNFTASKLAWVKQHQPAIYDRCAKFMLPGDFIAMKLTGEITTTVSALSEGIFFDFKTGGLSEEIIRYFGFDTALFPPIRPVFSPHGYVLNSVASGLGLTPGIPITYKAGDQPNNALSLNVLQPGEVAASAGTSGVIYGVSDQLTHDARSRVNTFAHVNHSDQEKRLGVLLCINGAGSMYRWAGDNFGSGLTYAQMNDAATLAPPGCANLRILPFGNGAERMLENKRIGAHFHHIDLNLHTREYVFRAVLEGIAFSFRYGLDILRENLLAPTVIRAGQGNLFLSKLFTKIFVEATGVPVELYANDGSLGAALGAGIGAGVYASVTEATKFRKPLYVLEPSEKTGSAEQLYQHWKSILHQQLNNH